MTKCTKLRLASSKAPGKSYWVAGPNFCGEVLTLESSGRRHNYLEQNRLDQKLYLCMNIESRMPVAPESATTTFAAGQ